MMINTIKIECFNTITKIFIVIYQIAPISFLRKFYYLEKLYTANNHLQRAYIIIYISEFIKTLDLNIIPVHVLGISFLTNFSTD